VVLLFETVKNGLGLFLKNLLFSTIDIEYNICSLRIVIVLTADGSILPSVSWFATFRSKAAATKVLQPLLTMANKNHRQF